MGEHLGHQRGPAAPERGGVVIAPTLRTVAREVLLCCLWVGVTSWLLALLTGWRYPVWLAVLLLLVAAACCVILAVGDDATNQGRDR